MKRKKLILIPGLLCDKTVWAHQAAHLKDIADISIADLSQAETLTDMLEATLSHISSEQVAISGHSMGGWIAIEFARRHPEYVSKLCLLSTTAENDTPEKYVFRKNLIAGIKTGKLETVIEDLLNQFVNDTAIRKKVQTMFKKNIATLIPHEEIMLVRENCIPYLPLLTTRTLTIHAAQDKVFNRAHHETLLHNIPGARAAIVNDSGHMVMMEQPRAVTSLMRFWLEYF
ncbi:MAG: alpha/beta hydrolase [Gammaproteobacteria bacterium]